MKFKFLWFVFLISRITPLFSQNIPSSSNDLKDHHFITCIVKWGKTQVAHDKPEAGLGAQFEKMSKKQKTEILKLLENARP